MCGGAEVVIFSLRSEIIGLLRRMVPAGGKGKERERERDQLVLRLSLSITTGLPLRVLLQKARRI